jgi:nucleoid-associated protein YgaU
MAVLVAQGQVVARRPAASSRRKARLGAQGKRLRQADVEGMLVLFILTALVCLGVARLGQWLSARTPTSTVSITVQRGDTLWSIASRYGDPGEYLPRRLDRLARTNGIQPGETLRPGDVLEVPGGGRPSSARVALR